MVGLSIPIFVTPDLHANVSPAMVAHSTAIITYRSNPHLDQRERGRDAAKLMAQTVREKVRPVTAVEMPPMVIPISQQLTSELPARQVYDDVRDVLTWPGVLSASAECVGGSL